MKILVFSDSHGGARYISAALAAHRGTADVVVHLGDGVADMLRALEEYPELPRILLRGNCDLSTDLFGSSMPILQENLQTLDGLRFLMLHGHTARVKYGYESMIERASALQADVVLFGHTHIPESGFVPDPNQSGKRIYLFNPGSIGNGAHPYGVLYAMDGQISAGLGHVER